MLQRLFLIIGFAALVSFGAQGTGLFFDMHASQGKIKGDKLYNLENQRIGIQVGDSIRYLQKDTEYKRANYSIGSKYPVEFQYAVRYSFLLGYEKSFNKVLSVRGAIGYQKVLLDAYAATLPDYFQGGTTEVPFVSSEIDRHWISIPVDFKAMIPIRRSGIYGAVGPKVSILLGSTYTDSLTSTEINLTDKTPRINFGIGFRVGAELAIARAGFLFFEGGYHKGLVNMSLLSEGEVMEGEIVPIGIGFRINLPSAKR